jgi:hypothetical protein
VQQADGPEASPGSADRLRVNATSGTSTERIGAVERVLTAQIDFRLAGSVTVKENVS